MVPNNQNDLYSFSCVSQVYFIISSREQASHFVLFKKKKKQCGRKRREIFCVTSEFSSHFCYGAFLITLMAMDGVNCWGFIGDETKLCQTIDL